MKSAGFTSEVLSQQKEQLIRDRDDLFLTLTEVSFANTPEEKKARFGKCNKK